MKKNLLGFIGAGNMARSLMMGLIADDYKPTNIWASSPLKDSLDSLHEEFGINVTEDNKKVVAETNVLILAVKPQDVSTVCQELKSTIAQYRPLVISIAAGISLENLGDWLGPKIAIVRAMPNAPATVQKGITALYANDLVSQKKRNTADNILRSVGVTLWMENERLMDAVTALSGSGPAYFLLFMEALRDAGIKIGLSEKEAELLTKHTALGTIQLALQQHEPWATLRKRITSPSGTTEKALDVFLQSDFPKICHDAVLAAFQRAKALANNKEEK